MKDTVSSPVRGKKCKRINLFANVVFSLITASYIGTNIQDQIRKEELYNSLYMAFQSEKVVEYGTNNYDTLSFVEKVENGEIVEYTKEIDTSNVGVQRLSYEIAKDDVSKDYLINVEVVDTKKPIIELEKESTTLYQGTSFDIKSNVKSVKDEVDGDIPYVDSIPQTNENGYYTVTSNFDKNKTGEYTVEIVAVDKNGNSEKASYKIIVKAKPVKKVVTVSTNYSTSSTYNGASSVDTSSVRNAAISLIGNRYVYATAKPGVGFDCSGLVYYVYSLFGKNLPRTASGLRYVGYEVSEENMQSGDIIVWSDNGYSPTHVSIYIGGGEMVHAANRRLGVVRQSVSYWKNGGRNKIISIRRV